MEGLIALAVLLVIVLIVLVNCIKIVPQAHAMVIERLGGYLTTWSVGLHLKVPFIDRIAKRVILKEQVVDFPPQPVITKDNVTMQIDTVVYFQITDPKLYAYGVENPIMAIENLTAILRAEAKKEATIQEAAGQAEAILKIQQANADGLRMLKEANPDNAVLQIKSLEAFAKAADGKATKIIIPSEIQGIAGLTKSIAEIAADKTEK